MFNMQEITDHKIHWQPQPKQAIALVASEDEILFGGARGGGKTDTGQAWLLYDIQESKYRALVIRRNATDLDDWIDRAKRMYAPCGGVFTGDTFTFPSGARIRTGHLKDSDAYTKYQGHEYQKMLIEELTHIPKESDFEKLLGSCRSTIPTVKPQIFATTNPDGTGYKWVKARWNIPDNPQDVVKTKDEGTERTRIFIPSRVQDNKVLMQADPGYIRFLESIKDEDLRKAWLEGSWAGTQVAGSYYASQVDRAHKEARITNVPYDPSLLVHTWWDLGVGDSTTIGFFQVVGQEWRMIDYHEASGEGLTYYKQILNTKGYAYGDHYAPHDIQVRELSSGKSRLEIAKSLGINFQITPNLPIEDGINAVRARLNTLWIDKEKCKRFIEAITQYRKEWNDKMGDWKPHPLHDWTSHSADMLRYWAVTKYQPLTPFHYDQVNRTRESKNKQYE